jgi:hypothetical protein
MANWKEIRRSVKKVASKAVSKTGDLSDTASLHVRLARKEAFLEDLYEKFGRVAYQKIKTGADVDRKLEVLIEKIDIVRSEIHAINRTLNGKKLAQKEEIGNAREAEIAFERRATQDDE